MTINNIQDQRPVFNSAQRISGGRSGIKNFILALHYFMEDLTKKIVDTNSPFIYNGQEVDREGASFSYLVGQLASEYQNQVSGATTMINAMRDVEKKLSQR